MGKPKQPTIHCPHCSGEILPEQVRAWWNRMRYRKLLAPCMGILPDGRDCGRLLGSRERRHACPTCGYNNWKILDIASDKGRDREYEPTDD